FHGLVAYALELQEVDDLLDLDAVGDLLLLRPPPIEEGGERAGPHEDVAAEQDVVEHAHALEQGDVLEGARHAAPGDLVRADADEGLALERDRAFLRGIEAGDRVDQRRLAGAVGPDEAVDLALLDAHRDIRQRLHAAEASTDVFQRQDEP